MATSQPVLLYILFVFQSSSFWNSSNWLHSAYAVGSQGTLQLMMLAETLTAELPTARTILLTTLKLNSVCCHGLWDAAHNNTHVPSTVECGTKYTIGMFACPQLEVMACSAVSDGR